MQISLELYELGIVVTAKNHNPTILNPDFLYRTEIISEDWKVIDPPVMTELFSRSAFDSGVEIIARPDKVVFIDREKKFLSSQDSMRLSGIAASYVRTLKHVSYRAVGINPKGVVEFPSIQKARDFLLDKFIKEGKWSSPEGMELHPKLGMNYIKEDSQIIINMEEGTWNKEGENKSGVFFSANYHRDFTDKDHKEVLNKVIGTVENCGKDVRHYFDFVNNYFLE